MEFDALIVGGGAAGISCGLVLGSGLKKSFTEGRKAGIIMHQKSSHLQSALLNNAFGVKPGSNGKDLLIDSVSHLSELYPELQQIHKVKVKKIIEIPGGFEVITNRGSLTSVVVVIAIGYTSPFRIKGLEKFVIPHKKAKPSKERIQLENIDHLVTPGLYVAGTLAGWRSQYSIAAGSGAAVATDILTLWNKGEHMKVHDKLT